MTYHIGFSGSRGTASRVVADAIRDKIFELAEPWDDVAVHHGCCDGTDTYVHYLSLKSRKIDHIYMHWPSDRKHCNARLQLSRKCAEEKPLTYRGRNLRIVNNSHVLVAAPRWPEFDQRSARSGTWMTIRMARRQGIPVYIIKWWELVPDDN